MRKAKDPGLGSKFNRPVKRIMNADGSYNIIRQGGLQGVQDLYKFLVDIKWYYFTLILFGGYLSINFLFATAYILIGVDHLQGLNEQLTDFENAFYFSAQTFTTVGYGAVSPKSSGQNLLAVIESFTGLVYFAVATGLLYGRFSKPASKIAFSKNVIITPFDGGMAVMFKIVNLRNNVLLNTKVNCIITIDENSNQKGFNKQYFEVNLETDQVNFFPLTWTLVHKINSDSPFLNLSIDDLVNRHAELIILIETFDETF
ncbi:MAG: ion transporter, partial [Bacteroidetes bacterium]